MRMRAAAREHRPLVWLLSLGLVLRIATMVAYHPALFYSDSWGYLKMASGPFPVSIAPLRPSGYPLLIRLFSLDGHSLLTLIGVQHLAGLLSGGLLYAALLREGVGRWLASAASALLVLDLWSVALEQRVLAEAFFTLALTASLYLALRRRRVALELGASGLLLALAATMRPVALFAALVWLAHLLLRRPGARALLAGLGGLLVPLLIYAALHDASTGTFGLTQSNGWFLYARIGQIVDCRGVNVPLEERPLCVRARPGEGPTYFLFSRSSPAHRLFGAISADHTRQAHSDAILLHFALRMILARPLDYLRIVGADVARFLEPGTSAGAAEDGTVMLPRHVRLTRDDRLQRVGLPASYVPHADPPAAQLSWLAGWLHTSRLLIDVLLALSAFALLLRVRGSSAVLLAAGEGVALLVGSAASAGFAIRYLLPAVPLIVFAGTLSLARISTRRPARTL